jgi:phosphatidate cytidylyltransferase
MLKQRIITAIILIPITIAILFYLPLQAFCILTSLITLIAAWEWSSLIGLKRLSARVLYLSFLVLAFFISWFIFIPFILIGAFIWWLLAILLIVLYPRWNNWWANNTFWCGLMGLIVLIPCWCALNFIRSQGIDTLLFLLVLIWGADSAAYFIGRKWGKTKLAPYVSPGKSVQGVCGAAGASVLITCVSLLIYRVPNSFWGWVITLSLVTVLFSIVGDLFESMIKRQAGVKDSGRLLPGHGGLLDRIDSLTAAAPIFALGSILLVHFLH